MSNPITDTFKTISDRVSSPLTGIFILSWFTLNWEIPIILLYLTPRADKTHIDLINEYISSVNIWQLLLYPMGITVVYLFAIPLLREHYMKWLSILEFRITRHEIQIKADLNEVGNYRQTISGINKALINKINRNQANIRVAIGEAVETNNLHRTNPHSNYSHKLESIEKILRDIGDEMSDTTKNIESFFNEYNGELPHMYESYIQKWGAKFINSLKNRIKS